MLVFLAIPTFAQEKYTEKVSTEDADIHYKWKYPMTGGVEGPAELLLKVRNKRDQAVSISFELAYILDLRTEATFAIDTCIKAKKTIYGKLNGLYFVAPHLSNEQLMSDGFEWEINDLSVAEIDNCPVDK